ncbi:MAG: hypothetical protein HY791_10875 [Deltaproteobacteria bacterium]|nr:hypothetical protein [Deltaproteobacteria bacterium]
MKAGRGLFALASTLGMALPAAAQDIERNFAGSAQLDYLAIPSTIPSRGLTFDGFTTELAIKLAVDFSDHVSANVKICYGCHGFETDMAFIDMRVADELNFRIGRMNAAFGDFPLRHDPANHKTNSKPLPYDMGRMLRLREWNMSVMPSPYVDNGLEVNGTRWFGEDVQLDYAAYVVSGFKGNDAGLDLDFIQSRSGSLYYVDNNSEPAVGGRIALTVVAGEDVNATAGISATYGHYDPSGELEYLIAGADLYLRLADLNFRAEYLIRKTEYAVGPEPTERFRYAFDLENNFFSKDGFYVEAEYPLGDGFDLIGRFDGLRRNGNVPSSSPLSRRSAVLRYTLGVNIQVERGMRLKLSGEAWDFSDFDDEIAAHVGVVANF